MTNPCAACKALRRKCADTCIFKPYFPPEQPNRFAIVHKVFGASNVAKLLNDLEPSKREDAVNSLTYEAEMRLRDPVNGCVSYISLLQYKIKQAKLDLNLAKKELASYALPSPYFPPPLTSPPPPIPPEKNKTFSFGDLGIGTGLEPGATSSYRLEALLRERQEIVEAQLTAALHSSREQEMLRFEMGLNYNVRAGEQETSTVAQLPPTNPTLPCQHVFENGFVIPRAPALQAQFEFGRQLQAFMQQQQRDDTIGSDREGRNFVNGPSLRYKPE